MEVVCAKCNTRYEVEDTLGGRWCRCDQCEEKFILPIPDPQKLFDWVEASPWEQVQEFQINGGARGHTRRTIDEFTKRVERRRWKEEYRIRKKTNPKALLSDHERAQRRADRHERRAAAKVELNSIALPELEERIVAAIIALGYVANRKIRGDGVNIEVWDSDRNLWAVGRCKRCREGATISSRDIREFAGAFALSGAVRGFYFTTGRLTRPAKRTAERFDWLKTFGANRTLKFIAGHLKL